MRHAYEPSYIGGQRVPPTNGEVKTVTSPNTEEAIASIPADQAADIGAAVSAAPQVFGDPDGWSCFCGLMT